MQPGLSIIIIDQDDESRSAIEDLMRQYGDHVELLGSSADFSEGYRLIQLLHPAIVILGVNKLDVGVEQIQNITSHFSHTSVFANATQRNPDWILHLIHAGAVEYLLKPVDKESFFEAFQKIEMLHQAIDHENTAEQAGKVISVYNPVGGMGTTTLAVNLAVALAQKNKHVALVDLNLFGGDVATFLDITPRYTLSSVTGNIPRLDASFLMGVMPRHSSGVYLLCGPAEVEEAAAITAEQVSLMLACLKQIFSVVIIDTGGQLYGVNEAILSASELILFNTVLSLPTLNNARRYLVAMEKRDLPLERVRIIASRYLTKSNIKKEDAEKVLGRSIFATLPNNFVEARNAINKGTPLISLYPGSEVASAVLKLAEMIGPVVSIPAGE
jgi:pilus assembly protein CpaE